MENTISKKEYHWYAHKSIVDIINKKIKEKEKMKNFFQVSHQIELLNDIKKEIANLDIKKS